MPPSYRQPCSGTDVASQTDTVDDMGLKALAKHSGEYLLEVFMRRYDNPSTIMTSNRPLAEWGKFLEDVPTASAILDHFLHHAETLAIQGRSYRLKEVPVAGGKRENKRSGAGEKPANEMVVGLESPANSETALKESVTLQWQRNFVQRVYERAKSQFVMGEYQVRKWQEKHHQMALVGIVTMVAI